MELNQKRKLKEDASHILYKADLAWQQGRMRAAFQKFLQAARAGVIPAYRIVAQFYDKGEGVHQDQNAAIEWYRRAYRRGDSSAANNIGCIWRQRRRMDLALRWFERAVDLGDSDANLEIAKVCAERGDRKRALQHLRIVVRSRKVMQGTREEARAMLSQLSAGFSVPQ